MGERARVRTWARVFDSPTAKILDLYPTYKDQPFTTTMAAEAIHLSFKTALKAITQLEKINILIPVKKIRNAKAYKFNTKHTILNCLEGANK